MGDIIVLAVLCLAIGWQEPHAVVAYLRAALCRRRIGEVASARHNQRTIIEGAGEGRGDALPRARCERGQGLEGHVVVLIVIARSGQGYLCLGIEADQNEEKETCFSNHE